jgi:hypothetical protein
MRLSVPLRHIRFETQRFPAATKRLFVELHEQRWDPVAAKLVGRLASSHPVMQRASRLTQRSPRLVVSQPRCK